MSTNTGPQQVMTEGSEGELRLLLEQVEGNRIRIRNKRDEHERQIDAHQQEIRSLDAIDALLGKTADDYRRALGETVPQSAVEEPKVEVPPPPAVNPVGQFDLPPNLGEREGAFKKYEEFTAAQAAREGVAL